MALLDISIQISAVIGRESITIDGVEKKYRVHIPPTYDGAAAVPLVLVFHMYTGHGRMMEWTSYLNQGADEEGFIVVCPDGYRRSWADGSGQFAADREEIDDLAFVSLLIDRMIED
jgi:polyhydroxybutyrate depolymerase